jgi:predicted metal-dependent hydrolase
MTSQQQAPSAAPKVASAITPRPFDVDLSEVPRHWMANHPVPTHIANGVNLLFPIGERFFVRSVNAYLDQLDDPQLRADVRAFFQQEGRHASAHDRFNQVLRDQGFEIDGFLERYERLLKRIEGAMSPQLRLSVTAAVEHYTAILAEGVFDGPLLDEAALPMKTLLAWHALEEIEHRSVAFDVLQQVNPSYLLRLAGLAVATATLGGFWAWGAVVLLRQDEARTSAPRYLSRAGRPPIIRRVFLRGIRAYIRKSFHPAQAPLDHLAAAWMARHLPSQEPIARPGSAA